MAGSRPASKDAGRGPASPAGGADRSCWAALEEQAALPQDAVEVARVAGAWGIKGGIKVKPFAADPQALFSTKRWYLQAPEAAGVPGPAKAGASPKWPVLLRIASAREQGGHVVATAHDLEDRDVAEALAGARVLVSRSSFPTPADDEYYWVDLIGLAVRNREGAALGTVTGLLETGPVCVLRVQAAGEDRGAPPGGGNPASAETLIPFVAAYIDRVDLPGRCIHVDWRPDY